METEIKPNVLSDLWDKQEKKIANLKSQNANLQAALDLKEMALAEAEGIIKDSMSGSSCEHGGYCIDEHRAKAFLAHAPGEYVAVRKKLLYDVFSDAEELFHDGSFDYESVTEKGKFFLGCLGDAESLKESIASLKSALEPTP